MKTLLTVCAFSLYAHGVSADEELFNMQLETITAGGASATATADGFGTHTSTSSTAIAEVRVGGIELKPGSARALLEQVSVQSKASAAVSGPVVEDPVASGRPVSAASVLITRFRNSR